MDEREVLANFLKEHRLKMTAQRKQILEYFLARGKHLSPDELFQALRWKYPRIGRATVYRTLRLLTQADLAQAVEFGDGARRFENKLNSPHHDHLICTSCGRSIEFLNPDLERLQNKIAAGFGFHPLRHRLEVFGLCRDCAGKRHPRKI
jgi:Fur family ferric uptake transcriptional regulator